MKKIYSLLALMLAVMMLFASCNFVGTEFTPANQEYSFVTRFLCASVCPPCFFFIVANKNGKVKKKSVSS